MSKEQPTKLTSDLTSIINLKAELLKKQEEFRLKRISKSQTSADSEYETHKTTSTWGKKSFNKPKLENEKSEPIETNKEPTETEDDSLAKSRKMLETKARYYEQVTTGQKLPEKDDEEIFLVNFDQKISENKAKTEKEPEKKFILKNNIDEAEYNEQLRLKWEKEKYENLDKLNIRYQDIRYDEIRNLGVGSFSFSKDESERMKQMEFFKNFQKETKINRIENEIYNLKREKALRERLSKVKQRRLLKHGYSLPEIKEMCTNFDQEIEEIEQEILEFEEIAKNPEIFEKQQAAAAVAENQDDFNSGQMKKKINFDREWDKPKLKEKFWEKHVEKLRNERKKQFAPPKSFEKTKHKQKIKKAEKETPEPSTTSAPTTSSSFIPFLPNLNVPPPEYFQADVEKMD